MALDALLRHPRDGWIETRRDGATWVLTAGGRWTTGAVAALDARLRAIEPGEAASVRVDLGGLEALDTAGAWLVHRTMRELEARGLAVELTGGRADDLSLIETVARNVAPCPPPPRRVGAVVATIARTGAGTIFVFKEFTDLVNFLGLTVIVAMRALAHPSRIRVVPLVAQMERVGLNAMPIVGLISFLVGVVLTYQGADQLARFGAQIFTVNLVGIGVLREMGVLLTAIIVAGRSGSAFTAQIGTMKVNEEVDAMRTIGLDPMEVLVLPRLFALMLTLPLLTFYADIMGLLGGAVMVTLTLDISFFQFARQLNAEVPMWSLWVGLIKAPVFAFVIAMVGCFEGLKVSGSAESVGRQTTRAVVEAIFLVIVLDAMFSILFSVLGI